MDDPRNQPFIDPYDHPSTIYTPVNNPPGDPNGEKFLAALKEYLPKGAPIPVVKLHGRGPGIDIPKTLALVAYDDFPDKQRWL